jgi:hypothetical protein
MLFGSIGMRTVSGPGKIPVVMRGRVYLVRIPLVFGRPTVEILPLVQDMAHGMAASLSERECAELRERFIRGHQLLYEFQDLLMEVSSPRPLPLTARARDLLQSAISDRETAVECSGNLDSMNAGLHARRHAEKMLKVYALLRKELTEEQLARGLPDYSLRGLASLCARSAPDFAKVSSDVDLLERRIEELLDADASAVVERVWAALRLGGFCACKIGGRRRRYQEG